MELERPAHLLTGRRVLGQEDRPERASHRRPADRPEPPIRAHEQQVDVAHGELLPDLEDRPTELPGPDRLAHLRQHAPGDVAQRTECRVLVEPAQRDEQGPADGDDDRQREQGERSQKAGAERAGDHSAGLSTTNGASVAEGSGSRAGGTRRYP